MSPQEVQAAFLVTGRRANLGWYRDRVPGETAQDPVRYELDQPIEQPLATSLTLMAPASLRNFLEVLESNQGGRDDWRRFLSCTRLVESAVEDRTLFLDAWREQETLVALEHASDILEAEEIKPGTGPALLPVPGGRIPLEEEFLEAVRNSEEFAGRAGEGVGRGTLYLWAIPRGDHLNVLFGFHLREGIWRILLNPCRIPAGAPYGL